MMGIGLAAGVMLIALGSAGILRAFPVVRDRKPTAPMPYPVGLPWLTNRPTTARTVLRIGQLYAVTGLIVTLYASAMLAEQQATRQTETCVTMADQLVRMQPRNAHFVVTLQHDQPHGSECTVRGTDGTEWFRVRSERKNDAIGEAFHARTSALERLGMALEPITVKGRRAIVGLAGSGTSQDPRILVESETAIHTIVVLQPAAKETELNRLLSAFRGL